jgi:hypothetical protein
MEPVHLKDRAVIALEGGEAREFLQGLVTNDVKSLAPATGLYAALLTPQGKILFDFLMTEGDGAVLLDCAADRSEALVKRLAMYRLRAKIDIAIRPQLSVYAGLSGRPAERAVTFADPRLAALGPRSIGASAELPIMRSAWRWACPRAPISAATKSSPSTPALTNCTPSPSTRAAMSARN